MKDLEDLIPDLVPKESVLVLVRENHRLFRRLSDQEKYNIESRRSLCEQRDQYKAELAKLREGS